MEFHKGLYVDLPPVVALVWRTLDEVILQQGQCYVILRGLYVSSVVSHIPPAIGDSDVEGMISSENGGVESDDVVCPGPLAEATGLLRVSEELDDWELDAGPGPPGQPASQLAGWPAAWPSSWLAGWLAGWLPGLLDGWPSRWLAGQLAGSLAGQPAG